MTIMLVRRAAKDRGRSEGETNWQILLILLMGIVFLSPTRFRSDRVHGLPTFAFATVLFSILLSCASSGNGIRHVRAIAIVLALTFMFEPLAKRLITLRESLVLSRRQAFDLERSKGIHRRYGAYQNAVKYIQEKVPETGRIFVGNSRHDKIHVADIIFYFLADRHSATKFDLLHPGITTTLEVQRHIISDIERHKVPYVVLWNWDAGYEPNEAAVSSGVTVLDDFIRDQYVPDRQFGAYHIWKRRMS